MSGFSWRGQSARESCTRCLLWPAVTCKLAPSAVLVATVVVANA
jgi:hypothetical protein